MKLRLDKNEIPCVGLAWPGLVWNYGWGGKEIAWHHQGWKRLTFSESWLDNGHGWCLERFVFFFFSPPFFLSFFRG